MKRNSLPAGLLTALLLTGQVIAEALSTRPTWLKAQPQALRAWQDMRFGMFVCWGPVSLTGKEIGWSRGAPAWGRRPGVRGGRGPTPAKVYDALYETWMPDKFDARSWVKTAQDAGMKYMIFLVKHHDGFCLYDTKLTDYKSTGPRSAWKVDVMKQIASACGAAGLKLIIYYSQPDWHHPDYLGPRHDRYIAYLHGQIRELLTNYGRIDGLWFDNLRGKGDNPAAAKLWDAVNLFKMARTLQPHLVINDRCGLTGDYATPEQRLGKFDLVRPWETCMTLGTQWAWKPNDRVKSLKQVIDVLVTCAVRNGNLALNTNPMPDGRIEPRQAERFREIGRWLSKFGQSIYATRGGPWPSAAWGGTTHRDRTVYVHVLHWPGESVRLAAAGAKVLSARVLTGGQAAVRQSDQAIELSVPAKNRAKLDTIVELTLDTPAATLTPGRLPSASLAFAKVATASNYFQKDRRYRPAQAFDDDPNTRWGCDWGTKSAWLAVDLGKDMTFDRARISEPYGRVKQFEIQAKVGQTWKAFYKGTTIGEDLEVTFAPVTARHVRLNLLKTTEGPSIWEFQLFAPRKSPR